MDGLLVGRFQPFHLGHLEALRFALGVADRLWVGVGSSNRQPEPENPFTADERKKMILSSVDDHMLERISIYDIPDVDDHAGWAELIDVIVPVFGLVFTNDAMTAHIYSGLRGGRAVRTVKIPFLRRDEISGTRIRKMIADGESDWMDLVPDGTRRFLLACDAKSRLENL